MNIVYTSTHKTIERKMKKKIFVHSVSITKSTSSLLNVAMNVMILHT